MEPSDRKPVSETETIQRHNHPIRQTYRKPDGRDIPCRISYLAEMTTRPNDFNFNNKKMFINNFRYVTEYNTKTLSIFGI